MSNNTFRGLTDKQLADILRNHAAYLHGTIAAITQARKGQRITSWWLVLLTLAVIALAVLR